MEKNIDIYNESEKCIVKSKIFYKDENNISKKFGEL